MVYGLTICHHCKTKVHKKRLIGCKNSLIQYCKMRACFKQQAVKKMVLNYAVNRQIIAIFVLGFQDPFFI